MPARKNQHYVPKHYLRAWATDGKLNVLPLSAGKIFPDTTDSVCSRNYFYGNPPVVEDELANLNGYHAHPFRELRNGDDLTDLSQQRIELLLSFITTQRTRSRATKEDIKQGYGFLKDAVEDDMEADRYEDKKEWKDDFDEEEKKEKLVEDTKYGSTTQRRARGPSSSSLPGKWPREKRRQRQTPKMARRGSDGGADTSSPDVYPDGSVAWGDVDASSAKDVTGRLRQFVTTVVGVGILAVTAPVRVVLDLPAYIHAFNRWLSQLLGALYGVARTLASVVCVVVGALFVAGLVGTGVPVIDETATEGAEQVSALTNATVDDGMNESVVEREFAKKLNGEREARGLNPVSTSQILRVMGDDHAENMRKHDYIGHVQPDGTTIEDRYRDRGLLPKCRLPTDSLSYYNGAENAAGAHLEQRVTHPGTTKSFYIDSEDELATFLLDSWMTSDDHRKVLLLESADEIGLGIIIADNGKVYAALEFC